MKYGDVEVDIATDVLSMLCCIIAHSICCTEPRSGTYQERIDRYFSHPGRESLGAEETCMAK